MNVSLLRWLLPAVMVLVTLGPAEVLAQDPFASSGNLVPAQFGRKVQDALGFAWNVNPQGTVQAASSQGFQMAGLLTVNGSSVSPSGAMMTADGSEYLMSWSRSGVQITRRVRIDVKTSTVRFVESFHNPQTAPVHLDVKIMSTVQSSVRDVLTDTGKIVSSGGSSRIVTPNPFGSAPSTSNTGIPVLGEKDSGLLVTRSSSNHPAALIYLAGPRSKLKPTLQRQGSYQFMFSYPVSVPAKETVSIVHGLAHRNIGGTPDAKGLAALFKPFQARDWTRDLPAEVRRSLLNAGGSYVQEETPRGPVLQAVMKLAGYWDVERGDDDVLVQDDQTRLTGSVLAGDLTVDTAFGKAAVPLEQVALLIGGGSVGRTMQLHLRNGEILVGPVAADEIVLASESGLKVKLTPRHINALFMHTDPADGQPPSGTLALLKTRHGDQLALGAESPSSLRAATAWGPIEVPLEKIDYLYPVRQPQPIHRLVLNDKSRLSLILSGSELDLTTLRFGQIKIAPGAIARLASVQAAAEAEEKEEANGGDGEGLKVPHCRLAGGNVLVGSIDPTPVELTTAAGITPLDGRRVRLMQREDEDEPGANPEFTFELTNGTTLTGRFRDGVFPLRALDKAWKVPAYHVLAFEQPDHAAAEQSATSTAEQPSPDTEEAAPASVDGSAPPGPKATPGELPQVSPSVSPSAPTSTRPAPAPPAPAGQDPFG
ncbi:MAG: hypothetical protein JXB62_13015 [Pirellulales bacterium]|nr:hypothetical protein [Pirellulales bacterium]